MEPSRNTAPCARRIPLMDELRGFAVLCMVFYHAFYTLSLLLGWQWCKALLQFFAPAEPWFAGIFLFLSGVACQLSRSNVRRGLRLLFVAAGVSVATLLFVPQEAVYFGILHLLSVCMILVGLTKPWLDRVPLWVGLAVCAGGFLSTMYLHRGFLGIASIPLVSLPDSLYTTNLLMPLGIYSASFFSSDYFPLFPWMFGFLGGVLLGRYATPERLPAFAYRAHVPFLSFLGRHALIFYIAHQPLIYGLGLLIQWLSP